MKKQTEDRNRIEDGQAAVQLRRSRSRSGKRTLIMLVCLTVMVALMFLTASVCVWMDRKMNRDAVPALGGADGNGGSVNYVDIDEDGNIVDTDGNVIGLLNGGAGYSQEELDLQVGNARQQAAAEVLENIRTELNNGDTILQTLRPLYPDDLIVYSGGQYNFVPINRNLKLHQYDPANVNILESGEYTGIR